MHTRLGNRNLSFNGSTAPRRWGNFGEIADVADAPRKHGADNILVGSTPTFPTKVQIKMEMKEEVNYP